MKSFLVCFLDNKSIPAFFDHQHLKLKVAGPIILEGSQLKHGHFTHGAQEFDVVLMKLKTMGNFRAKNYPKQFRFNI